MTALPPWPGSPARRGRVGSCLSPQQARVGLDQHAMAEQLAQRRSPVAGAQAAQAVPFGRRTHRPGHPDVMTRSDGSCCRPNVDHLPPPASGYSVTERSQKRAVMPTSAARVPAVLRARLIAGAVSGNAPEWSLWSAGSAVWFAAAGRPRLADAVITRRRCGGGLGGVRAVGQGLAARPLGNAGGFADRGLGRSRHHRCAAGAGYGPAKDNRYLGCYVLQGWRVSP
jgi:hypothetical protein